MPNNIRGCAQAVAGLPLLIFDDLVLFPGQTLPLTVSAALLTTALKVCVCVCV